MTAPILLVDDHAVVREGIAWLLSKLPVSTRDDGQHGDAVPVDTVVVQVESAEEALKRLKQSSAFTLIVLDYELPGISGLDALERLQQEAPQIPIVILSANAEADTIVNCLNQGARGFVPKTATPEVLRGAVALVLAGGVYVPQEALAQAPLSERRAPQSGEVVKLTPRQTDVLRRLALGESNRTIAGKLGMSESTVRVHVAAVLRALNVENRTQAATSPRARSLLQTAASF